MPLHFFMSTTEFDIKHLNDVPKLNSLSCVVRVQSYYCIVKLKCQLLRYDGIYILIVISLDYY